MKTRIYEAPAEKTEKKILPGNTRETKHIIFS